MSSFKISEILDSTGARLHSGDSEQLVSGISTDTRTLRHEQLFLALSGPNFDGNLYARQALERGAAGVLVRNPERCPADRRPPIEDLPTDSPVLVHAEPRRALSDLAGWHRSRLSMPVLGITGSCGKTTTKNILLELLSDCGRVIASPSSFNNDIGVPHTLFLADQDTQYLVVEMGTNSPGEIASLCRTARPTAGVITNVGASHLEGLSSLEGVACEKGALAASLPQEGFCVLNGDCRWSKALRGLTAAEVITFSVDGEGDLNAKDVLFHSGGTSFQLDGREITSPLLGLHNVQNLLAALAACRGVGVSLDEVLPAVGRLRGGRRRMERVNLQGITLFDDSYNSNPQSARASVRVLAGLYGYERRVLVLGDMLELGELAGELHYALGVDAARGGVDRLVLVGDLTRATAAGALESGLSPNKVTHLDDVQEALRAVPEIVQDGDVVLIKGSRRMGLDGLINHLIELRGNGAA